MDDERHDKDRQMTTQDEPTIPLEGEETEPTPEGEETEPTLQDEEAEPTSSPGAGNGDEDGSSSGGGGNDDGRRQRPLYYNLVSHIGALIVVLGAILILLSLLAHVTSGGSNPYVGIFTYAIFPTFVLAGVVTILIGMRWEAGRRRRAEALKFLPYPRIDLNDTRQRRIFLYLIVGGTVVSSLLVWASYQGFHYTESVTFCGQVCHVPMQPEFTAYQDSPHARVPCVACHVGEGASWYVRSKLSGARQLIAVLTHSYETPIPTPVAHLRPARETCEKCHWPEKFSGAALLQLPHYRYNETNDAEQISLNLKIGGGNPSHGKSQGIHWHMVVNNTITFAAADKKLQNIPWVKVRHANGKEEVYVEKGTKLSKGALAKLPRHTMDCMDCHNRPAHDFKNPDFRVDQALLRGQIPTDLPWIKKVAVDSVFRKYDGTEDAHAGIRAYIRGFYREKYPEILQKRKKAIDKTIDVVISIYDHGVFPKMKVDWRSYPVNIGHRDWPGCFRCHDGKHMTKSGKVLPNKCDSTCHTMPERGTVTPLGQPPAEPFPEWHPWKMPKEHLDIKGHDKVMCYQCHASGKRPARECKDCHEK
jgi:nitrate/TMAO reductase-like tetraheme cytochrome c subunit